tara:strand:+ start:69 stop:1469 length:1401 start_codon:yes stop_codon:yes gene_type:complete
MSNIKQYIFLIKVIFLFFQLILISSCSSLNESNSDCADCLPRPVQLNEVSIQVDFNISEQNNFFISGTYINSFTPLITSFLTNRKVNSNPAKKLDIKKKFEQKFSGFNIHNYNVNLYKISYFIQSVVTNEPVQVSGLFIVPDVNKEIPILVFSPGSRLGDSAEVPSEGNSDELYTILGSLLSSTLGFATFIPDYVGWGDSDNFTHHYMNANEAVQIVLNGVEAAYEFSLTLGGTLNFSLNKDVILSGYSQGGVAALLSTIYVERFPTHYPNINLVASLPMGGVPNLREHIIQIYNNKSYELSSFLPYILITNDESYDFYTDFADIMDADNHADIEHCITSGEYTLMECDTLIDSNDPLGVYEDDWLNAFLLNIYDGNYSDPLERFVFENSAYYLLNDWEAQDHLGYRFYHCSGDTYTFFDIDNDFVDYLKSEKNANASMINFGDYDHMECIIPSITDAVYWLSTVY